MVFNFSPLYNVGEFRVDALRRPHNKIIIAVTADCSKVSHRLRNRISLVSKNENGHILLCAFDILIETLSGFFYCLNKRRVEHNC